MRISFVKYEGAGNDFLLMRSFAHWGETLVPLAPVLCDRRRGIGADGVLALEETDNSFIIHYYNADGSEGFCGNGARCAAHWAHAQGLRAARFRMGGRVVLAFFDEEAPEIAWREQARLHAYADGYFVDGAAPHMVCEVEDLEQFDVLGKGSALRRDTTRFPSGANVDFVSKEGNFERGFAMRTYERGVEGETLSCGTGAVAVARVLALKYGVKRAFSMRMRGGRLRVRLSAPESGDVWLQGAVRCVFEGSIDTASLKRLLPAGQAAE